MGGLKRGFGDFGSRMEFRREAKVEGNNKRLEGDLGGLKRGFWGFGSRMEFRREAE